MIKIGAFKIQTGFKLTGRGLVVLGQIVEGFVKIGSYITFNIDNKSVTMEISGVEMADINRAAGEFAVGLLFVYRDENHRKEFEILKLKEQLVDITIDELPQS